MDVYTITGKKLTLQQKPIKSGGEGAVYQISGFPDRVAKIYLQDADKRKEKISAMVALSEGAAFRRQKLSDVVAWPRASLFDDQGNFVGFGMNCISAKDELDDLYAYPARKPASMQTKLGCLISLCDIVERVHAVGQVIGDFNPNNIKVSLTNQSARLVDVDSCHIRDGGREYRCIVCAPGYVAPELITRCRGTTYENYSGTTFTKETDRFALAVHCFRMLFNGAHPFRTQPVPRAVGSAPAPLPVDLSVERGETPYFKKIPGQMIPIYAPDTDSFPPYLVQLFQRAFMDGAADPTKRPSATEWKQALEQYRTELKDCGNGHAYWKQKSICPYCQADGRVSKTRTSAPVLKMPASVPKAPAPLPNYGQATVTPTPAAAAAATASSFSWMFWIVTLTVTALLMFQSYEQQLVQRLVWMIIGDPGYESVASVVAAISSVAGIIGSIVYNSCWAPGRFRADHSWTEYFLSVLTGIGFAAAVVVAAALLAVVIALILGVLYLVVVVLIVAGIIGGLCSG